MEAVGGVESVAYVHGFHQGVADGLDKAALQLPEREGGIDDTPGIVDGGDFAEMNLERERVDFHFGHIGRPGIGGVGIAREAFLIPLDIRGEYKLIFRADRFAAIQERFGDGVECAFDAAVRAKDAVFEADGFTAEAAERGRLFEVPLHLASGLEEDVADDHGGTGGDGRSGIGNDAGIGQRVVYAIKGKAESFGGHLCEDGFGALPPFGGTGAEEDTG